MKVPMSLFYEDNPEEPCRLFKLSATGGSVADINIEELVYLIGCDEYNTHCRAWCELDKEYLDAQPANVRELMNPEPRFLMMHYDREREMCWSAKFNKDGSLVILSNDDHAARFVLRCFVRGDAQLEDTWQYSGQWIEDGVEIAEFLGQTHSLVASEGFGSPPGEAEEAIKDAGKYLMESKFKLSVASSLKCVELILDDLFNDIETRLPKKISKKLSILIQEGILPRYIEAAILGTVNLAQNVERDSNCQINNHEAEMAIGVCIWLYEFVNRRSRKYPTEWYTLELNTEEDSQSAQNVIEEKSNGKED